MTFSVILNKNVIIVFKIKVGVLEDLELFLVVKAYQSHYTPAFLEIYVVPENPCPAEDS